MPFFTGIFRNKLTCTAQENGCANAYYRARKQVTLACCPQLLTQQASKQVALHEASSELRILRSPAKKLPCLRILWAFQLCFILSYFFWRWIKLHLIKPISQFRYRYYHYCPCPPYDVCPFTGWEVTFATLAIGQPPGRYRLVLFGCH